VIFVLPLKTTPCPGITVSKSSAFNFSSVAIHSSGYASPMYEGIDSIKSPVHTIRSFGR
jgi:hypothetical protein